MQVKRALLDKPFISRLQAGRQLTSQGAVADVAFAHKCTLYNAIGIKAKSAVMPYWFYLCKALLGNS